MLWSIYLKHNLSIITSLNARLLPVVRCFLIIHHLLGASLAREFKTYIPVASELNIRSLDTSNPVVAGLLGHRYMANQGLNHKPSQMLADMIATQPDLDQMDDIIFNTTEFKKIIGR